MEVTNEELFGDLTNLQTIDQVLDTPVDTSIEYPTTVGEIVTSTPSGYDSDMMGEMPEYDPLTVPAPVTSVEQLNTANSEDGAIVTDEDGEELDPRLQELLSNGSIETEAREAEARGVAAAAEYRQRPDVVAQVERYEMMFAAAQNEDKMTGGNRAAMIQNPLAIVEAENYKADVHIEHYKNAVESVNYLLNDANPLRAGATNKLLEKVLTPEQ